MLSLRRVTRPFSKGLLSTTGENSGHLWASIPVDVDLSRKMMEKEKLIQFLPEAHSKEHSLEIQLPFLQVALKPFKLVPIVMEPSWSWDTCQALAKAIAETVRGKKVLLIASTDLSHFHPYNKAVELDKIVLNHIDRFDPERLNKDLKEGRCEACGGGPIVSIMLAAKALGADKGKTLKYLNSGDVAGDKSRVVGYGAGVFYKTAGGTEKMREEKEGWSRPGSESTGKKDPSPDCKDRG